MTKKLSKKAQRFVSKIKAQYGAQIPYQDDNYSMEFDYANPIADKKELPVMTPGNPGIVQPKSDSSSVWEGISQGSSLISPFIQLGTGISGLIQGAQEKKRQRAYESNAKEDYKRRLEQHRANDFYNTPYTIGRSDSYQQGGQLSFSNEKNTVNDFMSQYQQNQELQNDSLNQLKSFYDIRNNELKTQWKQKKAKGLSDTISGAIKSSNAIATSAAQVIPFLQKGGILTRPDSVIVERAALNYKNKLTKDQDLLTSGQLNLQQFITERAKGEFGQIYGNSNKLKSKDRFREKQEGGEISSTEDLYSPDFQSPYEQTVDSQQLQNKIAAEQPGEKLQGNSNMLSWLFEEEPFESKPVNDAYFSLYGQQESQEVLPIQPVVDKLHQMGIKPSSVNTGEHNVGSLHGHGKAVDLGLNTSFGGDQEKMNQFYQFLTSAEGRKQFPNIKIRDERNRPAGQKVWSGSHLHLELTD